MVKPECPKATFVKQNDNVLGIDEYLDTPQQLTETFVGSSQFMDKSASVPLTASVKSIDEYLDDTERVVPNVATASVATLTSIDEYLDIPPAFQSSKDSKAVPTVISSSKKAEETGTSADMECGVKPAQMYQSMTELCSPVNCTVLYFCMLSAEKVKLQARLQHNLNLYFSWLHSFLLAHLQA